jgi:hypothetical protein
MFPDNAGGADDRGRSAVRTGATQAAGITLWEVTIAEALKSNGYATGLFGPRASRSPRCRDDCRRPSGKPATARCRSKARSNSELGTIFLPSFFSSSDSV